MTESMRIDDTLRIALADMQTVTKSGESVARIIDGVKTATPVNHVDHRGRVFEIFPGVNEYWSKPLVYCYAWTIRAMQIKGWGLHFEKADRYTLIHGEVLTILYDARLDSPTHGVVQKVSLSAQGIRQLTIPAGVWHMNLNLSEHEVHLLNHPTEVYHHEKPDRLLLPWDAQEIPIDLGELFPLQFQGGHAEGCS